LVISDNGEEWLPIDEGLYEQVEFLVWGDDNLVTTNFQGTYIGDGFTWSSVTNWALNTLNYDDEEEFFYGAFYNITSPVPKQNRVSVSSGINCAAVDVSTSFAYSYDGIEWSSASFPLPGETVAYGNGVVVMQTEQNSFEPLKSTGLTYTAALSGLSNWQQTWSASINEFQNEVASNVIFAGGNFYISNMADNQLVSSADGYTWTAMDVPFSCDAPSCLYSLNDAVYFACGEYFVSSTDEGWVQVEGGFDASSVSLFYVSDLYVAVDTNGDTWTSTDGQNFDEDNMITLIQEFPDQYMVYGLAGDDAGNFYALAGYNGEAYSNNIILQGTVSGKKK